MTVRKRIVVPSTLTRRRPRAATPTDLAALLATPAPQVELPPIPQGAKVSPFSVTLGCDPEFFFERAGAVVGSEKIIGKKLAGTPYNPSYIVMDGVQVELNPPAGTCREGVAGYIVNSMRALQKHLAGMKDVKANFTTCIDLSKTELDGLSDEAKKLGCAPSLNRADAKAAVTVNGATSLRRSAGGHIHLGLSNGFYGTNVTLMKAGIRERLVDILDIFVGNTCVLLDRDPNAAERRKVYGRAGEYRLPKHGLEYRTLSNFWLRHYTLMSFVMAIARQAAGIVATTESQSYYAGLQKHKPPQGYASDYYVKQYAQYIWDAEAALRAMIGGEEGMRRVRLAINTNNWDLAKQNFDRIKPFIQSYIQASSTGFSPDMLGNFETLITMVRDKGLEAVYPIDPLTHWAELQIGGTGWESFIRGSAEPRIFKDPLLSQLKALPNVGAPAAPRKRLRKVATLLPPPALLTKSTSSATTTSVVTT